MRLVLLISSLLFLNGCCYNQYARDGYSVGLDCFTPSKKEEKKCKSMNGKPCDSKVIKVQDSIKARSQN